MEQGRKTGNYSIEKNPRKVTRECEMCLRLEYAAGAKKETTRRDPKNSK